MRADRKTPGGGAKSRILDASGRLFMARGVRAVSLDEIADAANLTKKTVYYHFASKDAVVAEWLTGLSAGTGANAAPERPEAEILALFDAIPDFASSPGFRGCPFVATSAELADPDHPAVQAAHAHKTARRNWFRLRLAALGARDPARAAAELMVVWDGALASSVLIRDGSSALAAKRLARRIVADCLKQ